MDNAAHPDDSLSEVRNLSPPRILVDGYNLSLPRGSGIATYARNVCAVVAGAGYRLDLLYDPDTAESWDGKGGGSTASSFWRAVRRIDLASSTIAGIPPPLEGQLGLGEQQHASVRTIAVRNVFRNGRAPFRLFSRPQVVRLAEPPALAHFTCPMPITIRGARHLTTIHDLIPLLIPGSIGTGRAYLKRLFAWTVRQSDHIVTVSEHSRQNIITLLGVHPDKVTNTYQSIEIDSSHFPNDLEDISKKISRKYHLQFRSYFLYYGAIEPKKNILRLIEAYSSIPEIQTPLVIVAGRSWHMDEATQLIANNLRHGQTGPGVVVIPFLPRTDLFELIRCARAIVFPSIAEGFGLPILEGFTLGTPVLTAQGGATGEIAGDAAVLVDPFDVRSIAAGLSLIDREPALREMLALRGSRRAQDFSPGRHAERLGKVYDMVLSQPRNDSTRAPQRPRTISPAASVMNEN
jgi:glycosyltransferase involved in cell wall biosynthesis